MTKEMSFVADFVDSGYCKETTFEEVGEMVEAARNYYKRIFFLNDLLESFGLRYSDIEFYQDELLKLDSWELTDTQIAEYCRELKDEPWEA